MQVNEPFGDWLKQRRKAPDLIQQDLAEQVAESLSNILVISQSLPLPLTEFVGRTHELSQVAEALNNPTCRLLTLVGLGGIGKTRLALQAAQTISTQRDVRFPDGVYFVPLQPLTSPEFILSAVAEAVGYQFYPGGEPLHELIDFLCPKTLLLILDNFEHLLDGVALVSEILAGAPKVNILATSRETLNLQEEWLVPVKGMSFPNNELQDNFDSYSAVRLFMLSARRARPDFSVDAERHHVLRICQLVEGMPLALEMTAAWLKRLPPHEIIEQLELGLDILEHPARSVPARHRTMRAVFEHSWDLLTEPERAVFKKLSVFRGGFRKQAAEAVAGATLSAISALVDKSLVRMDNTGRYDLHELLRQYGEEQLNASPELSQQVRDLHCAYYADFVAQRRDAILVRPTKTTMEEMASELKNVRSALEWAVERHSTENIEKIGWPLSAYYLHICLYQEGEDLFGKAVMRLSDVQDHALGAALTWQGRCLQALCRNDEARTVYEASLSIARQNRNLQGIAQSLFHLSEIAIGVGDYNTARRLCQEALERKQEEGVDWQQTYLLANLGRIAHLSGDFREAERLFKESVAAAQEFNVSVGTADALNCLGSLELDLQTYQAAKHSFGEGLAHGKEIGYRRGEVVSLIGLGKSARWLGEYQASWQYFSEALSTAMSLNQIPNVLDTLTGMASLLIREKYHEQTLELLMLVLHHRAANHETKKDAKSLLSQLESQLSLQVVAAAVERATTSQLDTVVESMLDYQPVIHGDSQTGDKFSANLLSERELEILRLIADGFSNREIAERLFLATSTVKWYTRELYSKLYVTSRTQAAARARTLHLLA